MLYIVYSVQSIENGLRDIIVILSHYKEKESLILDIEFFL